MKIPTGPMKYVIIKGSVVKNLDIYNFWLSLTIHDPQNKFAAKKWVQNNIKKASFSNKSPKLYSPKYRIKNSNKSYPE